MIQKKQLMQPIQDQIFIAVQEIAANKRYDFVLDKAADVVMLYSADRFDISEQVLRYITRSSKREQAQNRQERKAAEEYYCKRATEIYDSYMNAPQLYKTDENGEREFLSKADAARTIAETRAKKDDLCS